MEKRIDPDVITLWRKLISEIVQHIESHSKFQDAIKDRDSYIGEDSVISHHRSFKSSMIKALQDTTKYPNLYMSLLNVERYLAHLQLSDYEYFDSKSLQVDSNDVIITINYGYIMDIVKDLLLDVPNKTGLNNIGESFVDSISRLKAEMVLECSCILS